MDFKERTFRDIEGNIVVQSVLGPAVKRSGLERRRLFPGIEVGLIGWQRAHSQGSGTGYESPEGIRYAPPVVNQKFQRLGIEAFVKQLFELKPATSELWLTTVTATHPRTLRLKEIQYRLDLLQGTKHRILFEASIEIENATENPRVHAQATPYHLQF